MVLELACVQVGPFVFVLSVELAASLFLKCPTKDLAAPIALVIWGFLRV